MLAFFVVCAISFVQGNFVKDALDETIYAAIDVYLKEEYKDNPKKAECMSEDFRRNRIVDKFYTTELITNPDKLTRELQPYRDAVNLSVYLHNSP